MSWVFVLYFIASPLLYLPKSLQEIVTIFHFEIHRRDFWCVQKIHSLQFKYGSFICSSRPDFVFNLLGAFQLICFHRALQSKNVPCLFHIKPQCGSFYKPLSEGVWFSSFAEAVLSQYSPAHRNNLSYTVHIPSLKELIKHSPRPWLYWSFVIPTERNWYFLTKCNLLEQTSSQVLMKRIQGNGHCASPGVMGPVVLCWCLLCMHLVMLTVLISTVPFN